MGMCKMFGFCPLIPTAIFLTVSFFVLFAAQKAGSRGLKVFAYVVATLLWISSALVIFGGRPYPMKGKMMQDKMMKMKCHDKAMPNVPAAAQGNPAQGND